MKTNGPRNQGSHPFGLPLVRATSTFPALAAAKVPQSPRSVNRELLTRFEEKLQATLARIWGEETPPADNIVPLPGEDDEPLARVAEAPTRYGK